MLLIKNKYLRQIAGFAETFSFLSLKLLMNWAQEFRNMVDNLRAGDGVNVSAGTLV